METGSRKRIFEVFSNPDKRMFRKMGYFDDQSGIMRRYIREREFWKTHLNHTRQFVKEAMQGKNCETAAVLGSGWLLDVPVEEMSRYFKKLYLFDIRHPEKSVKSIHSLGNVEFRVCDISGFARPVYEYAKQYRKCKNRPPVSDIQIQNALDLSNFDFVFSCNMLNQLDILLIDYLAQFFELNQEEIMLFRRKVQQHHIHLLPAGRSCIVADYEEITCTSDGVEISRKTSVHHPIAQRTDVKRWTWKFDTQMTYCKDRITFFEVLACKM